MQAIQERITATEYYQLPEYEQHTLIQLIDGQVVMGMPHLLRHQAIVREILVFLTLFARQHGGTVYDSPVEVYLDEHNVYEPDVLYIAPDNTTCQLEEKRIVGVPDLVVEILSPSTARYDRGRKYRAYEEHGVREYWIVDPAHDTLEVWTQEDGTPNERHFQRMGAYAPGLRFTSTVLKSEMDVTAFLKV